jgi:hypothetical protein
MKRPDVGHDRGADAVLTSVAAGEVLAALELWCGLFHPVKMMAGAGEEL